MKNKKYYVLYKVIKNENEKIIDLENMFDFTNYKDIRNYLKCINRDISKMINNNINNFDTLKTFKNYCIIKEDF